MAYKKEELESKSIMVIIDNNLMFQDEIFAFVPFARSTFYEHKLEKSDAIKKALNDNRIKTKHSLKAKWYKSDNPTVQIALYKLIGTEEEYHRLSGTKTETANTHQFVDSIKVKVINGTGDRSKPDISED